MEVLDFLALLSESATRATGAAQLAAQFGAAYFLIFILDEEVNVLLPAPGFPQTIPDGKIWQPFLAAAFKGTHEAIVPFPQKDKLHTSFGFPIGNAVAVFIGAHPAEEDLFVLRKVLPVVASVLHLEHKMKAASTIKESERKTVEEAEKLTQTLDILRWNLQQSLNRQEQANKEIRELMTKKDEFMNMASHELKTPITSVKAYLQIITNFYPEIKANQALFTLLKKTTKQTDRMVELINDLLDVSRIQSGQLMLTKNHFNISELIDDCIEGEMAQQNTHRFVVSGGTNIMLCADRGRIEQVIINLISNAVKYSPEADKVLIETSVDESNTFSFRITDYGIGIPEEAFTQLFSRFFRVDASSYQFTGLGLGLYISSEIIKRHNGTIGLESKVGEGSTFWFSMPVE